MSPQIAGVAAAEEAEADRELCTERSKIFSPVLPSAANHELSSCLLFEMPSMLQVTLLTGQTVLLDSLLTQKRGREHRSHQPVCI